VKNKVPFDGLAKYWFILLLVIILQVIFAWHVVVNERESSILELKSNAKNNFSYLHSALQKGVAK
jgi:uncharacterized protein (UPF0333 family)